MRTVVRMHIAEVLPPPSEILEAQGVPKHRHADARSFSLALEAIEKLKQTGAPAGILAEVSTVEFARVFHGDGRNHPDSPVQPIAAAATGHALFAATMGEAVSGAISECFRTNDFALGSMLDAAASCAADRAAQLLEDRFRSLIRARGPARSRDSILRFSPGYCGWHLSSQKNLFEMLRPEEVGMMLNESCLMQPLKSVSGGILSGRKDIFYFEDTFPFCRDCGDHSCRYRIQALMNE